MRNARLLLKCPLHASIFLCMCFNGIPMTLIQLNPFRISALELCYLKVLYSEQDINKSLLEMEAGFGAVRSEKLVIFGFVIVMLFRSTTMGWVPAGAGNNERTQKFRNQLERSFRKIGCPSTSSTFSIMKYLFASVSFNKHQ